jgi:hypothetical protein
MPGSIVITFFCFTSDTVPKGYLCKLRYVVGEHNPTSSIYPYLRKEFNIYEENFVSL